MPHQVFSAWHSRRLVEYVTVFGVGLHSIFALRLGTLAIAYGLQYLQHRYLNLKILVPLELAKFLHQLFHPAFLVWH